MSSSSSTKPYKSRLLNFLNRQYINFNSQVGLKFRQFSYLVSIGVKTLIYPVYLIFDQTKKLTDKSSYNQQSQEKFLQSTNLAVEEKSINSLNLELPKPEVINSQNKSPKLLLFFDQTIAKLESWEIFPAPKISQKGKLSTQQFKQEEFTAKLDKEIKTTISNQKKENLSLFLLIQSAVEYFFGNHKQNHSLPENSNNQLFKQSSNLDLSSDKYYNNKQLQSSKIKQLNQQIKDLIEQYQQKTHELIPVIENRAEKLLNQGLNQVITTQKKLKYYLDKDDNPFEIQTLIWAAIDYFFQVENKENLRKLSFTNTQELIIADDDIDTNWLSWQDLFGEIKDDSKTELNHRESTTNNEPDLQLKQEKILPKTKQLNHDVSVSEKVKQEINEEEIEAKVIEIKYEKHLLEIILEKLDQIILWLEEFLLKIWQWLNSFIAKKEKI